MLLKISMEMEHLMVWIVREQLELQVQPELKAYRAYLLRVLLEPQEHRASQLWVPQEQQDQRDPQEQHEERNDDEDGAETESRVPADSLVEHVPRRDPELGREEHADAQAEQREAHDAPHEPFGQAVVGEWAEHVGDPTRNRVTPSWY